MTDLRLRRSDKHQDPSRRRSSKTGVALIGLAVISLAALLLLGREVVRELRSLNSASSDNVHWTLSQAEVEMLELQHAIDEARLDPDRALDRVVVEFDIFYSRTITLAQGRLFADLREDPAFGEPVASIRRTLSDLVPLIDGPRDALRDSLDEAALALREMRPEVRAMATAGLRHFARESDSGRESVAVTMTRLALATGVLLLALAVLLFNARRDTQRVDASRKALSDAYARLNTILDTSLDGVIVAGMDGRIVDFNPAAERIFGRRSEDVCGRRIGDIIVPEHLRRAHEAGMARMRDRGEMRIMGQGRVQLDALHADGTVFPAELAIERASTDEGDLAVAFLRDISHRVEAERELVEARDRALAGEKAKAEFLAMMTHEIRTPLNGILGNLTLLQDGPMTDEQRDYLRNMAISGDLLMHHVDAVLDVARFEAGGDASRPDVVDVAQLVKDIVDSQSIAAAAKGNALTWAWAGKPAGWLAIDASRLQQILLNLVGNAVKFTRDGRIHVELDHEDGPEGAALELRVIDTGVGISEADQARIFEDFRTVDRGEAASDLRERGEGGTGLGLAIARRFAGAMGGAIGVESTPGEGSVFWLRVPVEAAEAPVARPEADTPFRAGAPLDVLVVEDNEINRIIARKLLERLGHSVTEAQNGSAAVDAASDRRFDLILMDIRMPVMDGLTATRRIRAGGGPCCVVPIVAFSANVLPDAKERFAAAGMSGFLGKPLQKTELKELLGRLVDTATPAPVPARAASEGADPMARLVARHRAELDTLFTQLDASEPDAVVLAEHAHRCAGSAAAFGQADLNAALVSLEVAAESGDPDALEAAAATARAAWKNAPAPRLE